LDLGTKIYHVGVKNISSTKFIRAHMTYIYLIPTHLVPHPTHFPYTLPFLAYLPPLPPSLCFVVTFQALHVKFAGVFLALYTPIALLLVSCV
jgi:hypothetical protein